MEGRMSLPPSQHREAAIAVLKCLTLDIFLHEKNKALNFMKSLFLSLRLNRSPNT